MPSLDVSGKMKYRIYHITDLATWRHAQKVGVYRTRSLKSDGFIHCSYPRQITDVANSLFSGMNDLVILVIEKSRLTCNVVEEDLYDLGENFPHVYGEIDLASVVEVVPFPLGENGTFPLPTAIQLN
jgi:uncharacterized protein (DUF952 family)